jgi:hypothetical protein
LHQTLTVSTPETSTDAVTQRTQYVASFNLTIPQSVVPKTGGIPDQCLSLPPTISVGDVLEGYDHAMYAQPRIDYRLRAVAKIRSPEGDFKTVQGEKEITVMPCSEPSPPVEVADFPGEFIGSAENGFRASLLGAQYLMTLSMSEPSPISMASVQGRHTITLRFEVEIQAAAGKEPSTNLYPLSQGLKDLKFKIQSILRAKTYYSTQPFPTIPSQTMVTAQGPIRLHDSVLKMSEVEVVSSSWQHKFLDDVPCYEEAVRTGSISSGSSHSSSIRLGSQTSVRLPNVPSSIRAWTTSLDVPLELNGTLVPTFCSAIASRQYSLITRIKVQGASVREFVLEAPLQVHHLPCAAASSTSEEGEPLRPERARFLLTQQMHDLLNDDLVSKPSTGENRCSADDTVASICADTSVQPEEELPDYY